MKVMCQQCIQLFDAKSEQAVFCSPSCRQMAYRDRKRIGGGYVDLYPVCQHCGKRMSQQRHGRQKKYCSGSCRTMAYRKREREARN